MAKITSQAKEILRSPLILPLINASDAPDVPDESAQIITALQNLTAITKANADQKDTLNALEQLLARLHQELQQSPQNTNALQTLLAQPQFASLPQLVGTLALSPFTMSDCG